VLEIDTVEQPLSISISISNIVKLLLSISISISISKIDTVEQYLYARFFTRYRGYGRLTVFPITAHEALPSETFKQCMCMASGIQCLNCRGVGGEVEPPVVCSTPETRCPGIPWGGGSVSTPSAVVNDAESPVCNDNDNE
jgi:hypothetical protein